MSRKNAVYGQKPHPKQQSNINPQLVEGTRVAFSVDPIQTGRIDGFRDAKIVVIGDDGTEYRIDPSDIKSRRIIPI